jgi:uncharacterized protein YaaW (UPF0174 family)
VKEFQDALALASDGELRELIDILFRRQFNPIDYVATPDPGMVHHYDRCQLAQSLEQRFRFLAADGLTVLRGQCDRLEYRHVLLQVCRYLKLTVSESFTTLELEAEIYLALLRKTVERLPRRLYRQLTGQVQASLAQSSYYLSLPPTLKQDPLRLCMTGGGAFALSTVVRPWLLRTVARTVTLQVARYEAMRQLARQGGGVLFRLQNKLALQVAGQRAALSVASYGTIRGVCTVLGPALWVWFLSDLGWRAIATNYARIIPAIFTLAQIRLAHAEQLEAA